MNNMIDLRSNAAARQQVQAVVRRAAAQQAPAGPGPAPLLPSTTATATAGNRPAGTVHLGSGCRNSRPYGRPALSPKRSTPPNERRSSPICKQSRRFEGADS